MGLFTKSLIFLLVAVSTPVLYRQFAGENTIKFMSSYYSNYKSIDQFLRQSAGHLDRAKEYVPDSVQIKGLVDKLHQQVNNLVDSAMPKKTDSNEKETTKTAEVPQKKEDVKEKKSQIRYSQCPGEDLGGQKVKLWTKEELSKYDGSSDERVHLAFLGLVYDVSANGQHYAKGAEYNAFAGRDATRAFVTGNFTHDLNDDIRDIDESLYTHIESWANFYNTSYPILGRLEGSFFDSRGCGTQELARVHKMFGKIEQDKTSRKEQQSEFPECNSEWNSDTKQGRVWCSIKSGGIEREWTGVPRIYNNNDGGSSRCACFNLDGPGAQDSAKYMSVYPGCDPKATECTLKQ